MQFNNQPYILTLCYDIGNNEITVTDRDGTYKTSFRYYSLSYNAKGVDEGLSGK